jgi:HEAT repeat protein
MIHALLGKVREDASQEPSAGWLNSTPTGVRVNALKALALHSLRDDPASLLIFRRAFYDADIQIATTALAALRSSNLISADTTGAGSELIRHLRYLAYNAQGNFLWPVQSEAAQTLSAILEQDAFPQGSPAFSSQRHLHADLLRALGTERFAGHIVTLTKLLAGEPVRACGS